jgi:hypothetical protein
MGGPRGEEVEPTPTPAAAAEDCGLEFSEGGKEETATDPPLEQPEMVEGCWGCER